MMTNIKNVLAPSTETAIGVLSVKEHLFETSTEVPDSEPFVLNVTLIEPSLKHNTVFTYFDTLEPGVGFMILNDHDPKPLYYQLMGERGNVFSWTYLEKGPPWWKVLIKKNVTEAGETIGEMVAADIRKADVFKKYGIDFCCGGKRSVRQACEEKGIDPSVVERELERVTGNTSYVQNDYSSWQPGFLADYIYNQHHLYYYNEKPALTELMVKVADHHGDDRPELKKLSSLFLQLTQELDTHFMREEKVLFPFIKALENVKRTGDRSILNELPSLTEPVRMMEVDHEAAGDLLAAIRKTSDDFTPPEGACNSFRYLYKKLGDLESDLQQHIHLENNVLFPKALRLEKELQ